MATYKGVKIDYSKDIAQQIKNIDASSAPAQTTTTTTKPKNPPKGTNASSAYDNVPLRNEEVAIRQGDYGTTAQQNLYNQERGSFAVPEPRLDKKGSYGIAAQYGLQGMSDKDFVGLTASQAMAKAKEIQAQKQSQVSANTSYSFNPQAVAGFKNTFDNLKMSLDTNNAEPWSSTKDKRNKNKALIDSYTTQFANQFSTPEEFMAATKSQDMQDLLKQYKRLGGDVNSIAASIGQRPTVTVTGEVRNPDGSYATTYSDGTTENRRLSMNADGTYTSKEAQTLDQYLGALNTPEAQKAYQDLMPENQIAQAKIAFEQQIPEQYRALYFGTPEQAGLLQQRKEQMAQEIKLLEREAKNAEKNARAQADFQVEKNNKEMEIESATIEENRLAAKNYMTGMLAKLGALNTTGAAPQAIATLEQKYQKQAQQLRSGYDMQNKGIEIKLNEYVDKIELDRDNAILKAKSDLSKSEEDVWKEIFQLQNTADRNTFAAIEKFTTKFQDTKADYIKEAKKKADEYAKEFANTINAYDMNGVMEGDIIVKRDKKGKVADSGILTPYGDIQQIENRLELNKGADGYVDSKIYREMFDKFVKAGGSRSEFLSKFPPNRYTNPQDTSLPSFLRFGSSARSEANTGDREI